MWTVGTVTCEVRRPDGEVYNALARDGTRPCCVSNGSAGAATIQRYRGKGKGVVWAETAT